MKKVFKKIRQELLIDNKFKRYLFYAIGEIVLVVIGILLALSLNNLKEANIEQKLERSLYNELVEELQIDLVEIQGNRNYNQRFLSRYKLAREIILEDHERIQVDTLALIATELTKFSDFENEGTAYQKLTVSGKIDLITNNTILNELQNLGILYNYINRIENNQMDFMFTIVPKITEYLRLNPLEVMHQEKLYSYRFHNDIELMISIGHEKDGLYKKAENDLEVLIDRLRKNLE